MKKFALAMAAAAALMFTAPAFTGFVTPAEAKVVKKVIIKSGHRNAGWRHHGRKKVVIIKRGGHHGMRHEGMRHGSKTVIKKTVIR